MGWAWKQDGRPLEQQLLHGGSPLEASLGSPSHWCHLAWGLWSQAVWWEGDSTPDLLSVTSEQSLCPSSLSGRGWATVMPPSCGGETEGAAESVCPSRTRSLLKKGSSGDDDISRIHCLAGPVHREAKTWTHPHSFPLSPPLPGPHILSHPRRGLNEDVTTWRTTLPCACLLSGLCLRRSCKGLPGLGKRIPSAREASLLFKAVHGVGSCGSERPLYQVALWAPSPHLLPPQMCNHSED